MGHLQGKLWTTFRANSKSSQRPLTKPTKPTTSATETSWEQALASLQRFDKTKHLPADRAAIDYYLANALAGLRRLNEPTCFGRLRASSPEADRLVPRYQPALSNSGFEAAKTNASLRRRLKSSTYLWLLDLGSNQGPTD